jgi:O-antigen ligase
MAAMPSAPAPGLAAIRRGSAPPSARALTALPMLALMIYFGSGLELYLNYSTGFLPLYGQLAVLGMLVTWVAVGAVASNGQSLQLPRPLPLLFAFLLFFCVMNVISFIYSPQSDLVVDALVARVKASIFLMFFAIVMLEPGFRAKFAYAAAFLAVLGSALTTYDFISPTFSSVPGRGASFYLNSNETATLLISFALIATTRLRLPATYLLWIVVSVGVLLTFSRSGWGLLILALFGLTMIGKLGGGKGRFVLLIAVALMFAVVLAAYLSGDLYIWVSRSSLAEFLDPNTLDRLGARGAAIDDYSSLEREDVFRFGVQKFLESPFIGWGVGYGYVWAESVNTHNMPLALAVDFGILGPLFYFGWFAVMIYRTRGVARLLSVILLITGLSTHNQLEFLADALVLAFAVSATEEVGRAAAAVRPAVFLRPRAP